MTTSPNAASESVRQAAGDDALLMSAIELATLARYRIAALVVVFNNAGYDSERPSWMAPSTTWRRWTPWDWPWRWASGRPAGCGWKGGWGSHGGPTRAASALAALRTAHRDLGDQVGGHRRRQESQAVAE